MKITSSFARQRYWEVRNEELVNVLGFFSTFRFELHPYNSPSDSLANKTEVIAGMDNSKGDKKGANSRLVQV